MDKILIVDLSECTSEILYLDNIEKITLGEEDLIFHAPLLSGYSIVGVNRLTVKTISKESKVGGHFAHYQKCNGYDYIVLKNKSEKHVGIYIDKEEISIKEIGIGKIYDLNENNISEYAGSNNLEIAYLGIAGINKLDFSKIKFRGNKSCGKNGLGKLMGEKKLIYICLEKYNSLIPYDISKLEIINNNIIKNINNENNEKWFDESNNCYGCILNCNSTSSKKIVSYGFDFEEALKINSICDKYGMDSITFSRLFRSYINMNKDENIDCNIFARFLIDNDDVGYKFRGENVKVSNDCNTKYKYSYIEELGFCKFLLNKNIMEEGDINKLIYSVLGDKS